SERGRRAVWVSDAAGRGRVHAVAGLRLHGRPRDEPPRGGRDLPDARRHPGEVPGSAEALEEVSHDVVAGVSGSAERRAGADVYGVGQPDAEREGLEGPVLPDHRRAPRDVPRPDGGHGLGSLRPRQGPALRALHGALRLRTFGGAGCQQEAGRQFEDATVAVELRCGRNGACRLTPLATSLRVSYKGSELAGNRPRSRGGFPAVSPIAQW